MLTSGIINLWRLGEETCVVCFSNFRPLSDLGSEGALTSLPELTVPGCDRASRSSLESILYENQTLGQEILWRRNRLGPRLDSPCLLHGDAAQLMLHIMGVLLLVSLWRLVSMGMRILPGLQSD